MQTMQGEEEAWNYFFGEATQHTTDGSIPLLPTPTPDSRQRVEDQVGTRIDTDHVEQQHGVPRETFTRTGGRMHRPELEQNGGPCRLSILGRTWDNPRLFNLPAHPTQPHLTLDPVDLNWGRFWFLIRVRSGHDFGVTTKVRAVPDQTATRQDTVDTPQGSWIVRDGTNPLTPFALEDRDHAKV